MNGRSSPTPAPAAVVAGQDVRRHHGKQKKAERPRVKPRGRSARRQQPRPMSITALCNTAASDTEDVDQDGEEDDDDGGDDDTAVSTKNPTTPSSSPSGCSCNAIGALQQQDATATCVQDSLPHSHYTYQQQQQQQQQLQEQRQEDRMQGGTQYLDSAHHLRAKEVDDLDAELGKHDLDVLLAARALGNMRHHRHRTLSESSSMSASSCTSVSASSSTAAMNSPVACSLAPVLPPINTFPDVPDVPPALPPLATISCSTSARPPGSPYHAHQHPRQQHLPEAAHAHGTEPDHSGHHTNRHSLHPTGSEHFISRVSDIPLVNCALKAYEQSKANSKVVKYAAEGVESGVQKVWRPVVSKLEPQLGQLDEFASRQLDKLEQKFPSIMESTPTDFYTTSKKTVGDAVYRLLPSSSAPAAAANSSTVAESALPPEVHPMDIDQHGSSSPRSAVHGESQPMKVDHQHEWRNGENQYELQTEIRRRQVGRDGYQADDTGQSQAHGRHYHQEQQQQKQDSPEQPAYASYSGGYFTVNEQHQQPRSRWQQVLAGAGAAAGASAAAISEESMRCLKYCLQWLQYASSHIEHQIALLRAYFAHLSSGPTDSTTVSLPSSAASTLTAIKREVVETLRKVVEIVGKYAGAALPGEARRAVRSFILMLPSRWATLHSQTAGEASPMASPMTTGAPNSPSINVAGGTTSTTSSASPGAGLSTTESAQRVFTLANESLVMLKSVAGIMGDTVQRAEAWVERLRTMGVTTGSSSAGSDMFWTSSTPPMPPLPGSFPPPSSRWP